MNWIKIIKSFDIEGPPCKHCKYWKPQINYFPNGGFDGVTFCHTPDEMWQDFSCFQAIDNTDKKENTSTVKPT